MTHKDNDFVIYLIVVWVITLVIVLVLFLFFKDLPKTWEKIVVGFLIFFQLLWSILITIGIVAARNNMKHEGDSCTKNDDCTPDLYCGGDMVCHLGPNGKLEGANCSTTGDCELGLKCVNSKCIKSS